MVVLLVSLVLELLLESKLLRLVVEVVDLFGNTVDCAL